MTPEMEYKKFSSNHFFFYLKGPYILLFILHIIPLAAGKLQCTLMRESKKSKYHLSLVMNIL